jgi:hypothetical protein
MSAEENSANVDALFMGLIMSLEASAMQSLGKMMNPLTGKIEKDLRQAQMTIDMLDMIEKKTAGNLSEDEENLTKRILYQLRMNYLDEVNAEKSETADKKDEEKGKSEAESSEQKEKHEDSSSGPSSE